MARMLFLLGALIAVVGCSSSPSANNALLGRTRIPAPSTGSISNTATSDPAYTTDQANHSEQPAAADTRATASVSLASVSRPEPVSHELQPKVPLVGDLITIPSEARRATVAAPSRPAADRRENNVIEISSLPSLDRSAQSTVRIPAEAVAETRQPSSSTQQASYNRLSRYGYAEDYGRLAGQLEHIQATNQWKLRYIQIDDGRNDDFGGSVVLSNPQQLGGLAPGDYVHVEGQITSRATTEGQFAPEFAITRVAKQ